MKVKPMELDCGRIKFISEYFRMFGVSSTNSAAAIGGSQSPFAGLGHNIPAIPPPPPRPNQPSSNSQIEQVHQDILGFNLNLICNYFIFFIYIFYFFYFLSNRKVVKYLKERNFKEGNRKKRWELFTRNISQCLC